MSEFPNLEHLGTSRNHWIWIFFFSFDKLLHWQFLQFLAGTGSWMRKWVVMPVTPSETPGTSTLRPGGMAASAAGHAMSHAVPGAGDERRRSDECCHAG